MKFRILIVTVVVGTIAGAILADQKQLGPEWKKKPDEGLGQVWRKLEIDCSRFPAGNVTTYRLTMLEKTELKAWETDDGLLASAEFWPTASMEIQKDAKGKPEFIKVTVAQMVHFDLNLDGIFDGVSDLVAFQSRIVLDGKYVTVESNRLGLSCRFARSHDHKINYVFEGSQWKVAK